MTLVKWNNGNNGYAPTFANLFDSLVGDIGHVVGTNDYRTSPAVNILETKDAYGIEVAAPGLSRERFNLQLDEDKLTISTQEAEGEKENREGKYNLKEFNYAQFSRTFRLPHTVDAEKITAKYEQGILKVLLPKKEEVKPRTIKIH